MQGNNTTNNNASGNGNVAALREAVERSTRRLESLVSYIPPEWEKYVNADIHDNLAALALSPRKRNCDVGTAEEQVERFKEYCQSNMQYYRDMFGTHEGAGGWDCREDCPVGKMVDKNDSFCDHCELVWAQMPYEAEGGDK